MQDTPILCRGIYFYNRKKCFPMVEKHSNKDRMREIVASIEVGIKELFESDKYQRYLSTMSRFHRYSLNNIMLIHMQRPDATHVAGYNKWRDQFGRHVKRGEKGIQIIAPTPYKKKVEEIKLDPDTRVPLLDKDGNAILEEKVISVPMFKVVSVFDVSQTDGKPLPVLASDLHGNVGQFEAFMEALRRTSPVPMEVKPIKDDMDGFFSFSTQSITIREGMSQVQTVSAAIHEIAHALLHNPKNAPELDAEGNVVEKDRHTEEVEAESISYAVCQYYGIDTGENSFGYIATWSQGRELPELRASLETINKTASALITDIDRHFAEICKERGITTQAQEQSEITAPEEKPVSPFLTQEEITSFSKDFAAFMVKVYGGESIPAIPAADEAGVAAWAAEKLKTNDLRPLSDALLDVYSITDENSQPRFTEQDALMDTLAQLNLRVFAPTVPETTAEQTEPTRYEYKLHSNFNRTTPDENTYIQQYTITKDWSLIPGDVLYVGAYEKCLELQAALKSGAMTPEQVKALEQGEKLYLISDNTYLHIQRIDEGFDYTLYDKGTMRLLDGGRFDNPDILLSTACMEICKLHDLDTFAVRLASLDVLETLQEAQFGTSPAPSIGEDMESKYDDVTETAPTTMLPDSPEQTMDEPLPDPMVTPQMMEHYGYQGEDMLPLSKDRAMELLDQGLTIYMLHNDNTEEMVFDAQDIVEHDGLFGITQEEWDAVKANIPARDVEKRFLESPTDAFAIYQLTRNAPEALRLCPYDQLTMPPDRAHYEAVYTWELYPDDDVQTNLENINHIFSEDQPLDFTGHSTTVGDIIALKREGVVSYHYCDWIGFKELPNFQQPDNYLKSAEMALEDDYGMIDGINPEESVIPKKSCKRRRRDEFCL